MNTYKVAGTKIKVECENKYLLERLQIFEADVGDSTDISVKIYKSEHLEMPAGDILLEGQVLCMKKHAPDIGFYIVRYDPEQNIVKSVMSTDENWVNIEINCLDIQWPKDITFTEDCTFSWMEYYSFQLMGIAFRYHILKKDGIVIHSSSLAYMGKGILFTAPSGTGKTTHVGLWEERFGNSVSIINDDTPVIRYIDDTAYVCGTPWSGSSDKYGKIEVPLKAIVVLEQSPNNRISRLSPQEALLRVMPRLFMPYFDSALMEKVYGIMNKLLLDVPIYHLACRPDAEAMEMSLQCIG